MSEMPNTCDVVKIERRVLQLLCQSLAARDRLAEALRQHDWCDLAHRVTFEIVCGALQLSAEQLWRVLPTRLTNAGFPDFPWRDLFLPVEVSILEAEILLREVQPPATS